VATSWARPQLAGSNEIKLEYGVAQVFALKFINGKNLGDSKFPPFLPRVLFTAIDDRKLFLDTEDAGEFEHALLDLRVQPADFISVTKIKHPRGGGHSIRVELVEDEPDTRAPEPPAARSRRDPAPAPPSRIEAQLERSVELARTHGASAFRNPPPAPPPPPPAEPASAALFAGDAASMLAAMCAAVDAIVETQAYAQRRGLGVTFSEESVRAIGLSIYIGNQRAGR
jgi:hypothetical protein